jgi:hypothetical protein
MTFGTFNWDGEDFSRWDWEIAYEDIAQKIAVNAAKVVRDELASNLRLWWCQEEEGEMYLRASACEENLVLKASLQEVMDELIKSAKDDDPALASKYAAILEAAASDLRELEP